MMNQHVDHSVALPGQRHMAIQARLAADGRVIAAELARAFATSEDTIRRDLRQMAEAGLCRRVYGGALPVSPASTPLAVRRGEEQDRKTCLARAALRLLRPAQCIVIDAGSTNLAIARALPDDMRLTVVTNALSIAAAVEPKSAIELILLGGRHDRATGAMLGLAACRAAERLRPDLYFLGTCALDPRAGLTAFDGEEADLKRALVETGTQVVAAVTDDKLGTRATHTVVAWRGVHHLVVESPSSLPSRCGPLPSEGPAVTVAGRRVDP